MVEYIVVCPHKRKLVRPLVLQLINCSRNFSSNSCLIDNTQSIIITNTNLYLNGIFFKFVDKNYNKKIRG